MRNSPHTRKVWSHEWFEWIAGVVLVWTLPVLLVVPGFAVIGLVVVALAAVAALVALAGAVLAMPHLLGHSLVQHLRARSGHRRHQAPLATGDPGWRTGRFERAPAA